MEREYIFNSTFLCISYIHREALYIFIYITGAGFARQQGCQGGCQPVPRNLRQGLFYGLFWTPRYLTLLVPKDDYLYHCTSKRVCTILNTPRSAQNTGPKLWSMSTSFDGNMVNSNNITVSICPTLSAITRFAPLIIQIQMLCLFYLWIRVEIDRI